MMLGLKSSRVALCAVFAAGTLSVGCGDDAAFSAESLVQRTEAHPRRPEEAPAAEPAEEPASEDPTTAVLERPEDVEGEPLDLTATSRIAGPEGNDDGPGLPCTGVGFSPAVLCVDALAAEDGATGTAEAPFRTIQAAVDAANARDRIQVAEGTYVENVHLGGDPNNDGGGKSVSIRGGFRRGDFGIRNAAAYRTEIDGSALALPVVQIFLGADTDSMVINGIVITGGRGLDEGHGNGVGGGLYIENRGPGTITVSHCEITGNTTPARGPGQHGGGVFAENLGAGAVSIKHNRILENDAGKGAGMTAFGSRITIERNLIADNVGHSDHGGGVYLSASATVSRNIIRGNVISASMPVNNYYGYAGGIIFVGGTSEMVGNVITDNYAPSYGSAVFWDDGATGTMRGDFIYANRCTVNGRSAIFIDGIGDTGSHVTIENATITGHECESWLTEGVILVARHSSVTVKSSILWENGVDFGIDDANSSASATYSITESTPGPTNRVGVDPMFANPALHDYHVRSLAGRWSGTAWVSDDETSPAVDGGDPDALVGAEPIPHGARIEMGAHGGTAEASKSLGAEACDAPAYPLAKGQTMKLVGTTTGTTDDLHSCWDPTPSADAGEAVYLLQLDEPGGTLRVSLDESGALDARLVVHDGACGSDATQYCFWSFDDEEVALLEPTSTTVFVVVETSGDTTGGKYEIDVSYQPPTCGDGYPNASSGEACDHGDPIGGCTAACQLAAPVAAADTCSASSPAITVGSGTTVVTSAAGVPLTTDGYGDHADGTCMPDVGGSDQVLRLVPITSGTMRVRIGYDATGNPVWEDGLFGPYVWDEAIYVRESCGATEDLACADDNFSGEEIVFPVTAGEDYFLFVDGYDDGWYSRGPYELQITMTP